MLRYFLLVAVLLSGSLLSGSEIAAFPYLKTLLRQEGKGPKGVFLLDREVLLHSGEDFRMKLFAPDGREIPMQIQLKGRKVEAVRYEPLELASKLYVGADSTPGVILENPEGKEIAGVDIVTAERNFDKLVRIEASDDCKAFRTVIERVPFYDYSVRLEQSQMRFLFPALKSRFIRVSFLNYPEGEELPAFRLDGRILRESSLQLRRKLRIDNVEALAAVKEQRECPEIIYEKQEPLNVVRNEEEGRTVIDAEFEPLDMGPLEILVKTGGSYLRDVDIYGSYDKVRYLALGKGEIARLFAGQPERSRIPFTYTASGRFPYYRLVIKNGALPPLPEVSLAFHTQVQAAVFEAENSSLILAYGGGGDTVKVFTEIVTDGIEYLAGPEQVNPNYGSAVINYRLWILAVVVSGLLILLFYLLWRGYKMIRDGVE